MLRALLAAALAAAAAPAAAWGPTGHRVIGELAQPLLNARAQAGVRAILGRESLAEASTWPDFMRSSPDEFWRKTASPWHYVTVPPGKTYAQVAAPPEGDAVTALQRFAATVRDRRAPLADRQLALRFIVHIVGDLHQPLHVGNGQDRGGNDVKITWFGRPTNLHAVWDGDLIDREQLSFTEWTRWLEARRTPEQLRAWSDPNPLTWIAESAAARDTVYPAKPELGYDYAWAHKALLDRRLEQAGVRLASYLNALFAKP